jgi:hypothetical protein
MASVLAHLFDTMPFAAAAAALQDSHGHRRLKSLPTEDVRQYIEYRGKDETVERPMAPVPAVGMNILDTRAWGFRNVGARVEQVMCRARENGYRAHLVLESASFGRHEAGRTLLEEVRVTTLPGTQLSLPLTPKFLHSKWYVHDANMAARSHFYWPLPVNLDAAVVAAYAYDLSPDGKSVSPYQPKPGDVHERAMQEIIPGGGGSSTLLDALEGDFMDDEALPEVGATVVPVQHKGSVLVGAPRILVVCSFACFKERADLEPGGMVGVTKLYPHIMIRSSVALTKVEGAVHLVRPDRTTVLAQYQDDGTPPAGCCSAQSCCDGKLSCEALPEINPLLIADGNNLEHVVLEIIEFWSVIVAYFDAFEKPEDECGDTPLRYVSRAKTEDRSRALGRRRIPPVNTTMEFARIDTTLRKVPFQGEFDNLHLAPRLQLNARSIRYFENGALVTRLLDKAARERLKLDRIAMAPICAHDCFHMHTRWLRAATAEWNRGWNDVAPYAVPGATMVPHNQDVDIILDGKHGFIYRVTAVPPGPYGQEAPYIPPLAWQIVMHHGAGYAQGFLSEFALVRRMLPTNAANRLQRALATATQTATSIPPAFNMPFLFLDADDKWMSPLDHSAVLYWSFRYFGEFKDGEWHASERTSVSESARKIARAY